ncbi:hypothetical protein TcBrA4_0061810 [Trypanosoma cruzi]|nr:hypothetical protein TcBrA4_0061810 [Trypanosoma cruzi]
MSWDALPSVPVRPVALHHALTHDGYFLVDESGLQEDKERTGHSGNRNSTLPIPVSLSAIGDMLLPVTLEEFELAEEVLNACESGHAPSL